MVGNTDVDDLGTTLLSCNLPCLRKVHSTFVTVHIFTVLVNWYLSFKV